VCEQLALVQSDTSNTVSVCCDVVTFLFVQVKTLTGKTLTLDTTWCDSIEAVKDKIQVRAVLMNVYARVQISPQPPDATLAFIICFLVLGKGGYPTRPAAFDLRRQAAGGRTHAGHV
jgi:hypothetical protein